MKIKITNLTDLNYYEILELLYMAEDSTNVIFNNKEYRIISKNTLLGINILVKKA